MSLGGAQVMYPILGVAVLLWFALGYRIALLRRGSDKNVRVLLKRAEDGRSNPPNGIVDEAIARGLALKRAGKPDLRRYLDEAFGPLEADLKRYAILVAALVAVAPLLGLLGTVVGMIETFESLGRHDPVLADRRHRRGHRDGALHHPDGPGGRGAGSDRQGRAGPRKQFQIETDLAQIKDILCSSPKEIAGMSGFALLHRMSLICATSAHIPTTPASRLGRSAAPFTKGGSKSQSDVHAFFRESRQ